MRRKMSDVIIHSYLDENEYDHVSEEPYSKDDHGKELAEEVEVGSEVQGVHSFQAYSEYHLSDAEDHGPVIPDNLRRVIT
jgi:hypothetical protein